MKKKTNKEIKTFTAEDKQVLYSALNDILFSQTEKPITLIDYLKKYKDKEVGVLNSNKVICVIAKTERAKIILYDYYNKDINTLPNLNYDKKKLEGSWYTYSYLNKILKVFEVYDVGVMIKTKDDYPFLIENKDWRIVLAPRVGEED